VRTMPVMRAYLAQAVVAVMALLAGAAAGCASTPAAHHTAALPGQPACFYLANFRGDWTVLSDSTLIVETPPGHHAYLIKLFQPVVGLRFQEALGLKDVEHTGQICNNSQDELVVRGHGQLPVPIVAVRLITPAEHVRLLKAAGQTVPRDLQKRVSSGGAAGASD